MNVTGIGEADNGATAADVFEGADKAGGADDIS
jgi:hypothetical protein